MSVWKHNQQSVDQHSIIQNIPVNMDPEKDEMELGKGGLPHGPIV